MNGKITHICEIYTFCTVYSHKNEIKLNSFSLSYNHRDSLLNYYKRRTIPGITSRGQILQRLKVQNYLNIRNYLLQTHPCRNTAKKRKIQEKEYHEYISKEQKNYIKCICSSFLVIWRGAMFPVVISKIISPFVPKDIEFCITLLFGQPVVMDIPTFTTFLFKSFCDKQHCCCIVCFDRDCRLRMS